MTSFRDFWNHYRNTGKNGNGIASQDDFRDLIEKERHRADRNEHEFSLLVVGLDSVNQNGNRFETLVERIHRRIRNIDEIGWYEKEKLGLILPFTSRNGAEKLANEICRIMEPWGAAPECEIYSYPLKPDRPSPTDDR
jgi:PleD family two-component response regulator